MSITNYGPAFRSHLAQFKAEQSEGQGDAWLETISSQLTEALRSYQMQAEVLDKRLTPNAALIRFKGNDNITVDRIMKRMPYFLVTWGIEVIAVRAGKGHIAVMVKRDDRITTMVGRLWQRRELPETAPYYNTSFVIGEREDNGELLYLNLTAPFGGQPVSGPHTLIAGESGGGKGIMASTLLLDICATNSPEMARIHLLDPKAGVDYEWLNCAPHLEGEIVTTMEESEVRYAEILDEMERRFRLLSASRCRDLDTYNERARKDGEEVLPRLYVVHDELADWMSDDDYRKNNVGTIGRLAAKGRAAGIHLIMITQRPDKKSLPGQVKANITNKICLRVSDKVNSNLIIDETGGEDLLGAGHMLAKIGGMPGAPLFVQAAYLDPWDAELAMKSVTDDLAASGETTALKLAA